MGGDTQQGPSPISPPGPPPYRDLGEDVDKQVEHSQEDGDPVAAEAFPEVFWHRGDLGQSPACTPSGHGLKAPALTPPPLPPPNTAHTWSWESRWGTQKGGGNGSKEVSGGIGVLCRSMYSQM